jgi:hypothetical protein
MNRSLVIAKYKEDVSWAEDLRDAWNVVVYSKDSEERSQSYQLLPNVGREAHTYLHYILENYTSLPHVVAFCQGNPLDHCPDFPELLKQMSRTPRSFESFGRQTIIFNRRAFPHLWNSPPSEAGMFFYQFFEHLLGHPCPPFLCCKANALFTVTSEQIRERPRSFYEHAMTSLGSLEKRLGANTIEGHFFERVWHVIFGNTPFVDEFEALRFSPEEKTKALELLNDSFQYEHSGNLLESHKLLILLNEIIERHRAESLALP